MNKLIKYLFMTAIVVLVIYASSSIVERSWEVNYQQQYVNPNK